MVNPNFPATGSRASEMLHTNSVHGEAFDFFPGRHASVPPGPGHQAINSPSQEKRVDHSSNLARLRSPSAPCEPLDLTMEREGKQLPFSRPDLMCKLPELYLFPPQPPM